MKPSSISVEINLKQISEFTETLKKIKKDKRTDFLNDVGHMMLRSIHTNYAKQGRYSSLKDVMGGRNKWKKLNPIYKAWKKKRGYPTMIGVRTGAMKQGFGYSIDQKLTNVSVWNTVTYARHFDKYRPVLVIQPEDIKEIQRIGSNYMMKQWERGTQR